MADTRIQILGLGISTIDDLLVVSHHPQPNEKQQVLSRTRQCGGLTGSALVAASRLGVSCGHVISLGDGELSGFLRQSMAREGVTLFENRSDPNVEPYLSIILIEQGTGERSIMWDNSRSAAPKIGEAETALALQADCLFVDHLYAEAILDVVSKARQRGVPVVGDFERTAPGSLDLMTMTDHLILPFHYACELLGKDIGADEAASRLAGEPGRSLACVTDGTRGSWYALGDDPQTVHHQVTFPMEKVVDTTGCGDVFHGVYAAGLVRGLDARQRLAEAAAAAAIKTQSAGAQAGAPTLPELQAFMASRRVSK
ncbi:MAG: PfkB family carbohydrate kinase [Planctomycetaceae bacterium]|nr:PfkB family carbohydrate kinase [Planctomycetaceae bacterium]